MSFRQAWLWQVMEGRAALSHAQGKHLLSRESLLDAASILFDECFYHQRSEHICKFVDSCECLCGYVTCLCASRALCILFLTDTGAMNEVRAARVSRNDFHVLALVGRGQFGTVELVRVKEGASDAVYALKTIPKKVATDPLLVRKDEGGRRR